MQTLWLNFTVNAFVAFGLTFGELPRGLMDLGPRKPDEPILPLGRMTYVLVIGVLMAVGTLAVINRGQAASGELIGHSMGVTTFSLFTILFALEASDERRSIFGPLLLENPTLMKMTFVAALAALLATELRLFQALLNTTSLGLGRWGICLGVAASTVVVAEAWKFVLRLRSEQRPAVAPPAELQSTTRG
ncbi:MAG: cation transporting ATPase C-terminal domain-containing protein [bacterium]|nr:cation transporting ATPase C-terminal domain-containing protein [bacterium]